GFQWLRTISGNLAEMSWPARDGLGIQGLLCLPEGSGPYPLILQVHGGPVSSFRNRWLLGYDWVPLWVSRGFAVFNVNPRGSTGRGREHAELVLGDMCGEDTFDHLAGVEHLVATGIADPDRLGVFGGSYGGAMASWLVTQTDRFRAAVAVVPPTD